jgi:tetratricopeptide (TPR) repeat protein
MRAFTGASPALAIVALLTMSSIGCSQLAQIQARRSFKAANQAYQSQDYESAAQLYEEALMEDPNLAYAHFYLANSYDNLYRPSRKGEPANDALLQKAVEHYQLAADRLQDSEIPEEKLLGKRALEFLVAVYGADKLNDPAQAEPLLQKMIQLEPGEPQNYFVLARIYEDAGAYTEAEQMYQSAKNVKPNDPGVYLQLARYYNSQGQFDKTIEALEQRAAIEPNNPDAFQTIASYYWDEATRDVRLTDTQKREYVQKGLEAVDKALSLRPDFVEALTFKGLLLRLQANLEKDPARQQQLLKEAIALSDKANEMKKRQTAGVAP